MMKKFLKSGAKRTFVREWLAVLVTLTYMLTPQPTAAQAPKKAPPPDARASDALHELNESIETLVQRISPSVVQIQVTGYGATQESSPGQTSVVIGKQRSI